MNATPIEQTWTQRPPATLEDIAAFIAREGLPLWRQMRTQINNLVGDVEGLAWVDFIKNIGAGTSGHFDITGLSNLTAGKDVELVQTAQPIPSKGNARDEFEMDNIELTGYAVDATTIRVYWHASGLVTGDYAFAYRMGV